VLLSRRRIDLAWLGLLALPWSHPTRGSIVAGLPPLATGVALRVWARGHLERAETVTTGGPYAHVRHPLYLGSFSIALAFALMTHLAGLPIVVGAAFAAMYVPKALREEAHLRDRFPAAYADYARRVGPVIPSWVAPPAPTSRFSWRRVLRHREWHTWIGVTALVAVLCGLATRATPRTSVVWRVPHGRAHGSLRASRGSAPAGR
jgi:hypothetical protein